ncbi:MAG: type VI secretion system baseplate subunit TssK [bacterium]
MSILSEINWSEGMFLRPHHFQAASRYLNQALSTGISQNQSYGWGIISLQVSEAQLENLIFEIRSARLRMPDGTFVCVPDNTDIGSREIQTALNNLNGEVDVFFALPRLREKTPNTLPLGEKALDGYDRRYIVHPENMEDENTGGNIQQLEVKKLNGRIFFGDENTSGYDTIRIARVIRSGDNKNTPILSKEVFPPVLELRASSTLHKLCQDIYHLIAAKNRILTAQVAEGNISIHSNVAEAIQIMLKIQTTASFAALIHQLIESPRIHPYTIYLEFCRFAGELSIFDKGMKLPDIALYDHNDLAVCFQKLCKQIEQLLEQVISVTYNNSKFDKIKENQLECVLKDEWLIDSDFYLSIESDYEERLVFERVNNIKLGAVSDLTAFEQRRLPGLEIQRLMRIPPGLPDRKNVYYFKVKQEGEFWNNVSRDKVLAVSGLIDPKMTYHLYILSRT